MLKHYFSILIVILMGALTITSCSNDDNPNNSSSSFSVNGENCEIHDASCSFHEKTTVFGEVDVPAHGAFTMQFIFDETLYYFSFTTDNTSSSDLIGIRKNLVSENIVNVNNFRQLTHIEIDTRFHDESGSLSISEKGSNFVIVNFSNFSFIKDSGKSETKYTINGKVKFKDINK